MPERLFTRPVYKLRNWSNAAPGRYLRVLKIGPEYSRVSHGLRVPLYSKSQKSRCPPIFQNLQNIMETYSRPPKSQLPRRSRHPPVTERHFYILIPAGNHDSGAELQVGCGKPRHIIVANGGLEDFSLMGMSMIWATIFTRT